MDLDKAYNILDLISEKNVINPSDIALLVNLSHHDNSEIRAYVAELLVSANDIEAERILITLSCDEDELVRVNACDSLSAFATTNSYKQLLKCILNDQSLLVKKYAILSLIDIMNYVDADRNELSRLFEDLTQKDDISITASGFKGLYMMGDKEHLNNIINLLITEDYRDRCTVVNVLEDIPENDNRDLILSALTKLRKTEKSDAVNSIIDKVISESQKDYIIGDIKNGSDWEGAKE